MGFLGEQHLLKRVARQVSPENILSHHAEQFRLLVTIPGYLVRAVLGELELLRLLPLGDGVDVDDVVIGAHREQIVVVGVQLEGGDGVGLKPGDLIDARVDGGMR